MAVMREKWTDERLDDLNKKVDDGFLRVDERFNRVDERFNRVDERFMHLERIMVQGFIALVTLQLTSLVAIIGFIAART